MIDEKIKRVLLIIFVSIILIFSNIRINISKSAPLGVYLVNRFSNKYEKGDYIVYRIDDEYKKYVSDELRDLDTVKEIKGTERDEVEYVDNKVLINKKEIGTIDYNIPINSNKKYIISKDEFLTIGDVENSIDGRYYGTIKRKDIKYKVYLIYRFNK